MAECLGAKGLGCSTALDHKNVVKSGGEALNSN